MQSATNTQFKQKTCPKCKNNHDLDGVLCSFCKTEGEIAMNKRPPVPPNFWIKCLIQREGDTELNLGNIRYTFRRNLAGDCVCEIVNQGHYNQILKSSFYEAYKPTQEVEKTDEVKKDVPKIDDKPAAFTEEQVLIIEMMNATGNKPGEIAKVLSEGLAEPIPYQRVMKFIAEHIKE
jgi:hypothetical protein